MSASSVLAAGPAPIVERQQVDVALRADMMRRSLLQAFSLPERTPCHVIDAKYEAGSYCLVLYQLGERGVTGVLSFDGVDRVGDGGVHLPSGMRAFLFPEDPMLRGLRAAMDPGEVANVLGAGRRARARVTLLRYRPAKRATIRIDLRTDGGARTLIAKVYGSDAKAAAVHAEARALAQALEPCDGVRVARPEGFRPELGMVIWEPVVGAEFEPYLDTARGGAYVGAAAQALAALHGLQPISARRRPVTAELERFHARATNIARVAPDTGRPLIAWAAALVERGDRVTHGEAGLVHGDCKPSQFRIDGSHVALLDFDHCGVADQASDVGTFLASLRQRHRRSLEAGFAAAYNARPGRDAAFWDRVTWYESVALLRKALRAFARSPRSPLPALLAREGLQCLRPLPAGTRWF